MNKCAALLLVSIFLIMSACTPAAPSSEVLESTAAPTQMPEATVEPTEAPALEPTSTPEPTAIPPTPSDEPPAEPEVFISSGVSLEDLENELTIYEVLQANEDIVGKFFADTTLGGFFIPFTDGFAPLTVFAPTYTLEDIDGLFSSKDQLSEALTYHVVPGIYLQADLLALAGQTIPTWMEGQEIQVSVEDGVVYLNRVAMVIEPDLLAENGIIHVIDTFLVPTGE